jgi:hypothetical protein
VRNVNQSSEITHPMYELAHAAKDPRHDRRLVAPGLIKIGRRGEHACSGEIAGHPCHMRANTYGCGALDGYVEACQDHAASELLYAVRQQDEARGVQS